MNRENLIKTLGPGILFASTAIGVSHLVQSTRAGAAFGFALLWAVILANLFKYPFFEYGSRYANATGTSIIDGYKRIGNWMLWLYFLIVLGSMFFVSAAVGFVTAGFMDNLFGISSLIEVDHFAVFLTFGICTAILLLGKYKVLDRLIKVIGITLLLSTLIAFIVALFKGPQGVVSFSMPEGFWDDDGSVLFLIALMGWMPTAVDLSTWNSLWTIERIKDSGYKPTLKETLFDFNFGYIVSAVLSICFLTLGAFMLFGTGERMPEGSGAFAHGVIGLYTQSIGDWSYIIIAAASFSIMFGTCIAVLDGYARALERTSELLFLSTEGSQKALKDRSFYIIALLLVAVGSVALILQFSDDPKGFKQLVDLATTISFLIAPVIAVVNFALVHKKFVGVEAEPPLWMKVLSYGGIVFLTGFSIFYLVQM